jgi:hypothetical protein
VDGHGIVAIDIENTDLQERPSVAAPISIVRSSSTSTQRIELRTACRMSASLTPCFRAGSPIRI